GSGLADRQLERGAAHVRLGRLRAQIPRASGLPTLAPERGVAQRGPEVGQRRVALDLEPVATVEAAGPVFEEDDGEAVGEEPRDPAGDARVVRVARELSGSIVRSRPGDVAPARDVARQLPG